MEKPKCVLFDLGGTLLVGTFDAIKGSGAILERARNPQGVTAEAMQELANRLDREILALKSQTLLESTARSFQRLLCGLLDLDVQGSPEELEILLWDASFSLEPAPGVREALARLKESGIGLAVLSNMTFGGELIARELAKHDLDRYFDFVASSADYGFRKPARILFEVVLRRAKCRPDQAWYVGDSFPVDVAGASDAGLYPVWYNPGQDAADSPVAHLEIHNWDELPCAVSRLACAPPSDE